MKAKEITEVCMNLRKHLCIDLDGSDAADKAADMKAAGGKFYGGTRWCFDLTYMSAEKVERIKAIANGGAQ